MEKINVPTLRFPGFDDPWVEQTIGSVAEIIMGQSPLGDSYNTTGAGVPLINGPVEFGEVNPVKIKWTTKATKFCENKDILFCVRGSTTGKMNIANDRYCIGRGIAAIRAKEKFNTEFIYQGIASNLETLLNLTTGSTFFNLDRSSISSFSFSTPNLDEQNIIAEFVANVDYKLIQLKKKKSLLEQYKKGMMQKIFNQEIRFKDDDGKEFGEWEGKTIGDIVIIKYGKDQKQVISENGIYPILGTGGEMGRTNEFLCDKPSVLIGGKGTIDKPMYLETPFWTVDTLFYTEIKNGNFPKWVFYLFQTINWYLYNEASGVPSLSGSTINKIPATVPGLKEQIKISNFLSAIDDKINLVAVQIEKIEKFKKGLLGEMFV